MELGLSHIWAWAWAEIWGLEREGLPTILLNVSVPLQAMDALNHKKKNGAFSWNAYFSSIFKEQLCIKNKHIYFKLGLTQMDVNFNGKLQRNFTLVMSFLEQCSWSWLTGNHLTLALGPSQIKYFQKQANLVILFF